MAPLPTVLLVDDEPGIRHCCELLLRTVAEVISVGSCDEARLVMTQRSFDVVLVDLVMPREFGDVLLREFKTQWPATKRVLLSASSHLFDEEGLVDGTIGKPFDRDELLEAVTTPARR